MPNDFFDHVDIEGIAEDHAKEVIKLQDKEARDLAKAYEEVRKELVERLKHAKFDRFTAQRLRSVLVQVNAAIDALNHKLGIKVSASTQKATRLSMEQLVKEIHRFDEKFTGAVRPISINVTKAALDTEGFLLNQYEDSLKNYSNQVKINVARALSQAALAELPYSQVVDNIGRYFKGHEWEIHRIARTELHHIYSVAKLNGMKELKKTSVPDLMKALYHRLDSRTGEDSIELSEQNPIIELNERFRQVYTPKLKNGKAGKTQVYRFSAPPNRPNDRAILIPYRPTWGESISSS